MQRTTRVVFIISVVGIFVLSAAILPFLPYIKRLFIATYAMRQVTAYHDLSISGTIVDEIGSPVQGVYISGSTSRRIKAGTDSITESIPPYLSESTFKLRYLNISLVSLRFSHKGYQTKIVEFPTGGNLENLKIVLKKMPADSKDDVTDYEIIR